MVKKNLPAPLGVVGAGADPHADAVFVEAFGDGEDVFDGAAEPVEFPHAQRVAGSEGFGERVALELNVLAVGGDAGQADEGCDERSP
jgi:hypothetical protein